jgi:hypothetical protein
MALYLHFPVRINAMTLNGTRGQSLLGTAELLLPSKFKLLRARARVCVCMYI